jgi:hypothetical protein
MKEKSPLAGTTLVDVGIPTYGTPRFLVEAIESVFAQTLTAWRLTISENGPGEPELASVVEPYLADRRVELVRTGKNLGAARNHTALIRRGQAPFVTILHDDDRWDPTFLERRVGFLDRHPECDFVFGANIEIDALGEVIARWSVPWREGLIDREVFVSREARDNVLSPSATLVRRVAYEAVGSSFDERFIAFDWEMWIRLGLRGPVGYLAHPDSAYRIHTSQTTARLTDYGADMMRFYSHIEELLRAELPEALPGWRQCHRKRSAAALTASIDALERRHRVAAVRYLGRAVATYPPSIVDPRVYAAGAGLFLGRRAPGYLRGLRRLVRARRYRVHVMRPW